MGVSTETQALRAAYRYEVETSLLPRSLGGGLLMLGLASTLFIAVDWFVYPRQFEFLLTLRLSLLAAITLVYFRTRWTHPIASAVAVSWSTGLMLITMVWSTDGPASQYYVGILLLMFGIPVMLPVWPKLTAVITLPLLGGYGVTPFFFTSHAEWQPFFVYWTILFAGVLVSIASTAALENLRFQDFRRRRELGSQNAALEHTLRQLKETQVDLARARHLASLGQLAAGVAHEVNNPMAFVQANLKLLGTHWDSLRNARADHPDPNLDEVWSEGQELIHESLEGVARVTEIVRDVKSFAQGAVDARQSIEISELLDAVLRLVSVQLGEQIRIVRDDSQGAITASASRRDLEQVFQNLILNAAHAIGEGPGEIRITTGSGSGQLIVRVEDDGCGIEPEVMERVFDPFFTTKKVGEGTGLGLAISHQIIKSHGGRISVKSQPGQGTCFEVRVPIDPAPRSETRQ